jgi:hypothetical protein
MNSMTLARLTVLVMMLTEWALLTVSSPYILRKTADFTKGLITRMTAVLVVFIIVLGQNFLYHAIASSEFQKGPNDRFLSYIYIVQHLVDISILFKAAFKLRANT